MGSNEEEVPHYNFESDAEPPHDEPGDQITIIKKRQVTKTIMVSGHDLGKPGKPYICKVLLKGYFAGEDVE